MDSYENDVAPIIIWHIRKLLKNDMKKICGSSIENCTNEEENWFALLFSWSLISKFMYLLYLKMLLNQFQATL